MKSTITKVVSLGMEIERFTYLSCQADFGVGDDWATLYHIHSQEPNKGHATTLLTEAKQYYESQGKEFGGSTALNEPMRRLYRKLGITEFDE